MILGETTRLFVCLFVVSSHYYLQVVDDSLLYVVVLLFFLMSIDIYFSISLSLSAKMMMENGTTFSCLLQPITLCGEVGDIYF
jgi:hypothetical protein